MRGFLIISISGLLSYGVMASAIALGIKSPYLWAVPAFFLVLLTIVIPRWDTRCTFCGSRRLKFLVGETGDYHWKYRNKDGSKDKRVKDNYEVADYVSQWRCKKCSAESKYKHYVSKKPSKNVEIWNAWLVKDGTGERKYRDYSRGKGSRYNPKSENRKGSS